MSYISTGSIGVALGTGCAAAGTGFLGGAARYGMRNCNYNTLSCSSSSWAVSGVCIKSYFSLNKHIGGMIGGITGLGLVLGMNPTPSLFASVIITSVASALGQDIPNHDNRYAQQESEDIPDHYDDWHARQESDFNLTIAPYDGSPIYEINFGLIGEEFNIYDAI